MQKEKLAQQLSKLLDANAPARALEAARAVALNPQLQQMALDAKRNPHLLHVHAFMMGLPGLGDRIHMAMEEVVANINDPNTKADAQRSITLKIDIKPVVGDEYLDTTWQLDTKLAKHLGIKNTVRLGKEGEVYSLELAEDGEDVSTPDLPVEGVSQLEPMTGFNKKVI